MGLAVSLAFVIIIGSSIRDQLGIVYNVPDHDNLYLVGPASGGSIVGEYRVKEELASIPEIQETAAFARLRPLADPQGRPHQPSSGAEEGITVPLLQAPPARRFGTPEEVLVYQMGLGRGFVHQRGFWRTK